MATNTPSPAVETVTPGADTAKLAVAAVLVVAAVVAFYALGQQDLWLRVVALLVLLVAAAATFFTSEPGKQLVAYGQDSVREVKKELVFEVAFDSAQESTRHKSGVALRFPRINRIRWDKPAHEAATLDDMAVFIAAT